MNNWSRVVRFVCRTPLPQKLGINPGPLRLFSSRTPSTSQMVIKTKKRGQELLDNPFLNRETAFTLEERAKFGLEGLLPSSVLTIDDQVKHEKSRVQSQSPDSARRKSMFDLMNRNLILFYRLLMVYPEYAAFIYTPNYSVKPFPDEITLSNQHGLYLHLNEIDSISSKIKEWPQDQVDVIVVTQLSRREVLHDSGKGSMNNLIGKLAMYVSTGGINPSRTLPVVINATTSKDMMSGSPLSYIQDTEYRDKISKCFDAIRDRWPRALMQFEDFDGHETIFPVLNTHCNSSLCVSDDIQTTASAVLATILASHRLKARSENNLMSERFVCMGSGNLAMTVCNTIVDAMVDEGVSRKDALNRIYMIEEQGLVGRRRKQDKHSDASEFKRNDMMNGVSLEEVVQQVKPTILLGLSRQRGAFTENLIRGFGTFSGPPMILILSKHESDAECSAEEVFSWSEGRAIFSSDVISRGAQLRSGYFYSASQCNNLWLFPGIGLATSAVQIRKISSKMLRAAARKLAKSIHEDQMHPSSLLGPLSDARPLAIVVAGAIVKAAHMEDQVVERLPAELLENDEQLYNFLYSKMWIPNYPELLPDSES